MYSLRFKIFIAVCLFSGANALTPCVSQNMERVHSVIDTLCSREMFGRGYTKNGAIKAADYISDEFKKINLKSYQSSFLQEFSFDVNTFPSACSLSSKKKVFSLGIDFIPHPSSKGGVGKGKVLNLNKNGNLTPVQLDSVLNNIDTESYILLLDRSQEALFNKVSRNTLIKFFSAKALLFKSEKLTHGVSPYQYPLPVFIVNSKSFQKIKHIEFKIEAQLISRQKAYNVVGYVPSISQNDSTIVFTAHYDHLGGIGEDTYFPGANDNASGVAMLLELAYWFKEHPSTYNIAFIAFGVEEAGLIGSKYFTENPFFPLSTIKVLHNIDLFATGEEGVTVVNGSIFKADFSQMATINEKNDYFIDISARGEAANSDHYFFYKKGVKSFFYYLRGNWKHYHDIYDKPPLPLTEFQDSFQFLIDIEKAYH